MKKTTLIIATMALFIFASAGCEETNTASSENENDNNTVVQDAICPDNAKCINFPEGYVSIRFDEPTPLETVLQVLDPSQKIFRMQVLDHGGATQMVALSQSYNDAPSILREYKEARDEMTSEVLVDLESWYSRSQDESLQEEVNKVKATLEHEPDSTLLVVQVAVLEE